jgi:hypothetical protein
LEELKYAEIPASLSSPDVPALSSRRVGVSIAVSRNVHQRGEKLIDDKCACIPLPVTERRKKVPLSEPTFTLMNSHGDNLQRQQFKQVETMLSI